METRGDIEYSALELSALFFWDRIAYWTRNLAGSHQSHQQCWGNRLCTHAWLSTLVLGPKLRSLCLHSTPLRGAGQEFCRMSLVVFFWFDSVSAWGGEAQRHSECGCKHPGSSLPYASVLWMVTLLVWQKECLSGAIPPSHTIVFGRSYTQPTEKGSAPWGTEFLPQLLVIVPCGWFAYPSTFT